MLEAFILLPCAHCSGDAQTDFIEDVSYIIECYVCNARTGCCDSAADAIAAWNRRVPAFTGTIATVTALKNPYNAAEHGEHWYVSAHAWDMAHIAFLRTLMLTTPTP